MELLTKKIISLFSVGILLFLYGCGGGGGGSSSASAPAPAAATYSISGTITSTSGSLIDSDVNDSSSAVVRNNSSTDPLIAQAVFSPVVLGGYATQLPTGNLGRGDNFATEADETDRYRVTLRDGQIINLITSDFGSTGLPNLNLMLFDSSDPANPVFVAATMDDNETESLTVSSGYGQYDVVVVADRGASNYILSIGQSAISAATRVLRMDDKFVPGEIIVKFAPVNTNGAKTLSQSAVADTMGFEIKSGAANRNMLLSMAQHPEKVFETLGVIEDRFSGHMARQSQDYADKYSTIRAVMALNARSDVGYADLNYILEMTTTPNDPFYAQQWHYPLINLPEAWSITTGDANVIVAVVDTGVFLAHTDLAADLTNTGYDFISDPARANDGNGIDPNPDDPGDTNTPGSSSFHGTHVAGTAGAVSNNASGVAGSGWSTRVMPVRVLGLGGAGTLMDVIQGIRYSAGLSNDSGTVPAQAADIINLSLGGLGSCPASLQATFDQVRSANVIVIASAGNSSSSAPDSPADCNNVIGVSAVDRNKLLAPYSNFGPDIDVAAPGGNQQTGFQDGVLSSLADDSSGTRQPVLAYYQGTSMASPHMAGVVALMKAVHPALTPNELDTVLRAGAITQDLANNGATVRDDQFGYGLIDALLAVQEANRLAGGGSLPAILSVNPSELDYSNNLTSLTLDVQNVGDDPIVMTIVVNNEPWLTVTPEPGCPLNGLCTYTATVDRNALVDGAYSDNIVFTANTGATFTVPVAMRVGAIANQGNTGFQFILLVDPETSQPIAQFSTANDSGQYQYSFSNLEPGSYIIVAGSDSDNDFKICDPGESCGGFPTVDQLQIIEVTDSDITNINFVSSYDIRFGSASAQADSNSLPKEGYSRISPVQ